jgi:hypothetical protein
MENNQQYSEMRARVARLGLSLSAFARLLIELGDDRSEDNIRRANQRMMSGQARVSGEMRALLTLLERGKGLPPYERPDWAPVLPDPNAAGHSSDNFRKVR